MALNRNTLAGGLNGKPTGSPIGHKGAAQPSGLTHSLLWNSLHACLFTFCFVSGRDKYNSMYTSQTHIHTHTRTHTHTHTHTGITQFMQLLISKHIFFASAGFQRWAADRQTTNRSP